MRRERGATLLIVLVMLVVITLLAVAGMRMSNSSLQVVGNMQARKFAENVASQALEDVLNSVGPFNAPNGAVTLRDRKSTRLNSSHSQISYAVFCLKKKRNNHTQ